MIPRTWHQDLTPRERRNLVDLLSQSPGLWPFGIVAGIMGLDAAVDACETGNISMAAAEKLREACYPTTKVLPLVAEAHALLMGLRLRCRRADDKVVPLQSIAKRLGVTLKEAQYALRVFHAHAVTPGYIELGVVL